MKMKMIMDKVKEFVYWCSIVAPIYDVLKGTWQAIVNIACQDEEARQKAQFEYDSTYVDYDNPVMVDLKKGVK